MMEAIRDGMVAYGDSVQGARVNNLKDISVEIRHGLAHRSTHH
jgi:hypothetical protein